MSGANTAIAVPMALAAAASFAVSNVAQMDSVRKQNSSASIDPGVVLRAASDPLWLAGLGAAVMGYVFQAIALALAPVVLVQPLIVAELPFALPMAALVAGRRLGRWEWGGALMVSGGLVALVAVIRPEDTPISAGAGVWVVLFGAVTAAVAVLLAVGRSSRGIVRTSAIAAAAGSTFGLLSVLTKAATHEFATRGVGALGTWQPWSLAVVGFVGLTLAQNAFRAGPLAVSLPLLDVGEPLVGSLVAVFAFDEQLGHLGTLAWVVVGLAGAASVAGVITLDRSPLVQAAQGEQLKAAVSAPAAP